MNNGYLEVTEKLDTEMHKVMWYGDHLCLNVIEYLSFQLMKYELWFHPSNKTCVFTAGEEWDGNLNDLALKPGVLDDSLHESDILVLGREDSTTNWRGVREYLEDLSILEV